MDPAFTATKGTPTVPSLLRLRLIVPQPLGPGRRRRGRLRFGLGLRSFPASLLHVDAASEVGAFCDRNAGSGDVAVHRAVVPDVDLLARGDIARDFAQNDDRLREDLCLDPAVRSDGQDVLPKLNLALDLAFDGQILASIQFALDDDRLSDVHG